jgi:hypothetical protein
MAESMFFFSKAIFFNMALLIISIFALTFSISLQKTWYLINFLLKNITEN